MESRAFLHSQEPNDPSFYSSIHPFIPPSMHWTTGRRRPGAFKRAREKKKKKEHGTLTLPTVKRRSRSIGAYRSFALQWQCHCEASGAWSILRSWRAGSTVARWVVSREEREDRRKIWWEEGKVCWPSPQVTDIPGHPSIHLSFHLSIIYPSIYPLDHWKTQVTAFVCT